MFRPNHIELNPVIEDAIRFVRYRLYLGIFNAEDAYNEFVSTRGEIDTDSFWLAYQAALLLNGE